LLAAVFAAGYELSGREIYLDLFFEVWAVRGGCNGKKGI
jgi:hypothetical protein